MGGWDTGAPGSAVGIVSARREKLRKHTRTDGGGGAVVVENGALCGALQSAELGFFGAGSSAVVLVLASGCKPFAGSHVLAPAC